MKVSRTYISCASVFALYFEHCGMDLPYTKNKSSVCDWDWPHATSGSVWPIFHSLVTLSWNFMHQIHYSFISNARFRRATLSCDSSYFHYYYSDNPGFTANSIYRSQIVWCLIWVYSVFQGWMCYTDWFIRACARQNQLNDLCPQRRLRSAWASA